MIGHLRALSQNDESPVPLSSGGLPCWTHESPHTSWHESPGQGEQVGLPWQPSRQDWHSPDGPPCPWADAAHAIKSKHQHFASKCRVKGVRRVVASTVSCISSTCSVLEQSFIVLVCMIPLDLVERSSGTRITRFCTVIVPGTCCAAEALCGWQLRWATQCLTLLECQAV